MTRHGLLHPTVAATTQRSTSQHALNAASATKLHVSTRATDRNDRRNTQKWRWNNVLSRLHASASHLSRTNPKPYSP